METQSSYSSTHEAHQALSEGEINSVEYVEIVKDYVDRQMGFGKYKGRAEGPAAVETARLRAQKPGLLRRLGNFMIDGYNPSRREVSGQ